MRRLREPAAFSFLTLGVPDDDGAVAVELTFVLARPRRLGGGDRAPHDRRPDSENLTKGVNDALSALGFWADDGQVSDLTVRKRYAASGEGASIEIKIMEAR